MTTLKFWIPGSMPSRNAQDRVSRGNKFAGAAMKKKWTNHVAKYCSGTMKQFNRVYVDFVFYEKNKRKDPDNIATGAMKLIFDGLQIAGVIPNDGWKNVEGFTCSFEIGGPGVAIVVREIKKGGV